MIGEDRLGADSLDLQLRRKRLETMILTLEDVALRLFEEHGFAEVTVDQIASEAKISPRTFYRYFPAKEDVLQLSIDRRSDALRTALAARPDDEPPLQSLRLALEQELSTEDMVMLRRWIGVVAATPSVLRLVVGGIQLESYRVMANPSDPVSGCRAKRSSPPCWPRQPEVSSRPPTPTRLQRRGSAHHDLREHRSPRVGIRPRSPDVAGRHPAGARSRSGQDGRVGQVDQDDQGRPSRPRRPRRPSRPSRPSRPGRPGRPSRPRQRRRPSRPSGARGPRRSPVA